MHRPATAAPGSGPPQDGEQPEESPEPPPPWPPPPPAPPPPHAPSPEPAAESCPEPAPGPCPDTTPQSATQLASELAPEPDTQLTPELAPELATQLVPELAPESVTQPAPDPVSKPASELTPEPAIEPAWDLASEQILKPIPALAPERVPEPATQGAPESTPAPAVESAPESCPKPSPAPTPAPCSLQCPVAVPERGPRTSPLPSPRTPVSWSRIKRILKEGPLLKNCSSLKRWKLRYFLIQGQKLYFAHHPAFAHFETIDLSQVTLAESSCRNLCHSFCVITPERNITLAAPSRKDMEEWINVIKTVQQGEIRKIPVAENNPFLVGMHYWYSSHSSRTQHCNICRESIPALSRDAIICEVCKVKSHRLCALRANKDCKWNTLSVTDDLLLPADEVTMPHQWVEGNMPVSSECAVCRQSCGSHQRLQDFRCLWCNYTVHEGCRRRFSKECCCGTHRSSVVPPTALSDPKGNGQLVVSPDYWNLDWSSACSCPLLIFINSKSGDHQGIVFLRKFKQYLNPSQVFDLSKGGPEAGLCMFKNFARFRVLVCGGDGSVSWVLSLIDAFGLHERCQLAVIPLGTGNDLARVLGWGAFWNRNKSPLEILSRVEQASVRILDRWSVMIRETPRQIPLPRGQVEMDIPRFEAAAVQHLESATAELNKVLKAKYSTEMIIATRFLCSAVEDFVTDVVKAWSHIKQNNTAIESVILKSDLMYEKLSVLVDVLAEDVAAISAKKGAAVHADGGKSDGKPCVSQMDHIGNSKLELATRAHKLQKSLKLIIFQVEQALDEESRQSLSLKNVTSTSTFFLEDDRESVSQTSPQHRSRLRGALSSISSLQNEDLDNLNLEHLHFTPETIRFKEKCVMNNYFGIGLDAKISLEFNTRRDEHPGQYNSRLKNKIWYGLLGSKELLYRSYRNLEERVHLECDGKVIPLPNLQGIVVLNITSYAGGINFWGSDTATTEYEAPAIDDGKLEVVAIFGSVQMAMSRIINLHHHRIAQCHEVMITIDGEEGIPVQVDGEAWIQRPGIIKIRYKNAAQMLTRDRDFENSMKMWECKHTEIQAALQPQMDSEESQDILSDEEHAQIQHLAQLAENLISRLNNLIKVHQHVSVLMDSVNASANILKDVCHGQDSNDEANVALCTPIETLSRNDAVDVTFSLKGLCDDTKAFLDENLLRDAEGEATLQTALDAMNEQFVKLSEIDWMGPILAPEDKTSDTDSRSLKLKIKFPKFGKKKVEEDDKPKSGRGIQGFFGSLWHRRSRQDQAPDDDPPAPSTSQF
ncbi:diacylglycerol kinase kappa [Ochotona curzoniae]|uniref:diacylglycerol kinase kappa n=1 Tax=Ochotona curzoniae TaxID=130825 RepID=UPI001B349915|nr:diacylglycerol kinase kappa [Ochotona curzoniae]